MNFSLQRPTGDTALTTPAHSAACGIQFDFAPGPGIAAAMLFLSTMCGAATAFGSTAPGILAADFWPTTMVGQNASYRVVSRETLIEIAPRSLLGYESLRKANPDVDPWLPKDGTEVLLPHFAIVPDEVAPGITINLPEYRLYFVDEDHEGCRLKSYPVGIGGENTPTPTGTFAVRNRIINPWWKVPEIVRKERKLPRVVAPGKDNPLGAYWLGISGKGLGIHGTNEPFGIGRLSSLGCIRLYPDDAAELFPRVATGTTVRIINQPIKLGIKLDALFLEAHTRLYGQENNGIAEVLQQLEKLDWRWGIDWREVETVLRDSRGIPRAIAFRPRTNY